MVGKKQLIKVKPIFEGRQFIFFSTVQCTFCNTICFQNKLFKTFETYFKERFSFLVMPWGEELSSFKVPGVGNLLHSCKKNTNPGGIAREGDGNRRN
jgi:thioredoxin-related protein